MIKVPQMINLLLKNYYTEIKLIIKLLFNKINIRILINNIELLIILLLIKINIKILINNNIDINNIITIKTIYYIIYS